MPTSRVSTTTIKAVYDKLIRRKRDSKPYDIQRMPRTCHVRFGNPDADGRATLQFITADGLSDELFYFTDLGLRGLAVRVTGAKWLDKMEQQVQWDRGPAMASADFAHFNINNPSSEKVRTFRIEHRMGVTTYQSKELPVIRAVLGENYCTYDNVDFVKELKSNPLTKNLPVISHDESDTMMRIRFALDPLPEDGMEVGVPIRMLEAWNSEVGQGSTRLITGLFTPHCLNGLHSTSREHTWRHIHAGTKERFDEFVASAIDEVFVVSSGMLEQYNAAVAITCDDLYKWSKDKLLAMYITGKSCARVEKALEDPRTRQDSSLAQLVDACTLAAQSERDLYQQSRLENAAYQLLKKGLAESKTNRRKTLRVPAEVS